MKLISKLLIAATFVAMLALPSTSKAQVSLDTYYNVDWQFNIPLNNHFSNVASGWGMNFEGGYYVTSDIAVGGFISFHTNNEYLSRRTISLGGNQAINTDQQHQMFSLPFGVLARYRFMEDDFQPYVGMKLGACYTEFTNYYYIFMSREKTWGFYMQPEVGFNFYPWANSIGFHVAMYYSFATNKCSIMSYNQSNLNNFGLRFGIAF